MRLRQKLSLLSFFILGVFFSSLFFCHIFLNNTPNQQPTSPSADKECMDVSLMRHYYDSSESFPAANKCRRKKVILSWTGFYAFPMDGRFFKRCPELHQICELTLDQGRYLEADALIFHGPTVNWSHLPPGRNQNQRYVFYVSEPPTVDWYKVDVRRNFYNWTMTHRLDSDIPAPYNFLVLNPQAGQVLDEVAIINKTGAVVWFVSNCQTPSKRERYVEELKKHISVDIYGLCGDVRICPKSETRPGNHTISQCEKDLINGVYKFYIAFENSVCRDYITEKFFGRRNLTSIPIVLSRRIVQDYLPPNSFIAADDFTDTDGPKKMADYLRYLMENPREYMKYFQWKKVGYSSTKAHPITGLQWGFCGLCQKLWRLEIEGRKESKVYKWVNDWFGEKVSCDANFMTRLLGGKSHTHNIM